MTKKNYIDFGIVRYIDSIGNIIFINKNKIGIVKGINIFDIRNEDDSMIITRHIEDSTTDDLKSIYISKKGEISVEN